VPKSVKKRTKGRKKEEINLAEERRA